MGQLRVGARPAFCTKTQRRLKPMATKARQKVCPPPPWLGKGFVFYPRVIAYSRLVKGTDSSFGVLGVLETFSLKRFLELLSNFPRFSGGLRRLIKKTWFFSPGVGFSKFFILVILSPTNFNTKVLPGDKKGYLSIL